MLEKIASKSQTLVQGGIVNKLLSSLIALQALNISITTRTVKDKVTGFLLPAVK